MKNILCIVFLFFTSIVLGQQNKMNNKSSNSQTISGVHKDSIYSQVPTDFLEHMNFLNNRDLDGDSIEDIIHFDYSGGAHCCYKLTIRLSSNKAEYSFPFDMDGGYVTGSPNGTRPQHFNIKDFDSDGKDEIFLEIETYNADLNQIPAEWDSLYGINSNYIIIDFLDSLRVVNISKYTCVEQYFYNNQIKDFGNRLHVFKEKVDSVNNKFGAKNENEEVVILPVLDSLTPFSQNIAIGYFRNSPILINNYGKILSEFKHYILFDSVVNNDGILLLSDNTISNFYFMNNSGNIINSEGYIGAYPFSEGLAAVQAKNEKWGYIDSSNAWVISPKFTVAQPFIKGKAFVQINGAFFIIDTKGNSAVE